MNVAVTKRFEKQIVIVTTRKQADQVRELADRFGISDAEVARDAIAAGFGGLAKKYRAAGMDELTDEQIKARAAERDKTNAARAAARARGRKVVKRAAKPSAASLEFVAPNA